MTYQKLSYIIEVDKTKGSEKMLYHVSMLNSKIMQLYNDKTKHLQERSERIKKYSDMQLLSDRVISCFKVDKKHVNGEELHAINEKGLIYVYNFKSRKLITILHARSEQIKRYYDIAKIKTPQNVYGIMQEVNERNKKYNLNNV